MCVCVCIEPTFAVHELLRQTVIIIIRHTHVSSVLYTHICLGAGTDTEQESRERSQVRVVLSVCLL